MTFKFSCPHCSQNISADSGDAGLNSECPSCNQPIIVPKFQPPSSAPARTSPPAAKPTATPSTTANASQQAAKEYLAHIRKNTCYHTLRTIIDVSVVLSFIAILCGIPIGWSANVLLLIGTLLGSIVILIAVRQSAYLLIDIADALLHDQSKN